MLPHRKIKYLINCKQYSKILIQAYKIVILVIYNKITTFKFKIWQTLLKFQTQVLVCKVITLTKIFSHMIKYQVRLEICLIILAYQTKGKLFQMVTCPLFCQIKQHRKTYSNMSQVQLITILKIKQAYLVFQEIIISKIFMKILPIFRHTHSNSKILVKTSLTLRMKQYHHRFIIHLLKQPQISLLFFTSLIIQILVIYII
ncbi:transmembrane protein, putative (macronuclear) [Tetrahymena thermophila SB210]|uniref:Transmembrane protein, putative n=1 Tax=Tetrahymena thermophila (strain SB210) TaxID=312017 RepID=W7XA51_TETTS|nr:transmembrane protein, putative [Tetrahymena thermophila SB210]EWS76275.1 transmembrane protein, putative [Tetrahymena thermophila SB210]|eukprot:XP_012651193.1 transmembrane protein, putative [Tetrahymena thermophila SB210]